MSVLGVYIQLKLGEPDMLKIFTKTVIVAASILTISSNALAKDISYDYIGVEYDSITDSSLGVDVDGTGFFVGGSFSISPNLAVTAAYGTTSYDRVAGLDIDFTELNFGITAHTPLAPNTDLFGNFSVVKVESEVSDGFDTVTDDETGNAISVGVRHMPSDKIELGIKFSSVDLYDDTDSSFEIGAQFYTTEKVSVGVGYVMVVDVDVIVLNARIDTK